jgi:16S rRNA C967 or C1407 C5-methylase (RsmB/RsmF family)/NOL1/NOP2/fmu family ribosome biogenesis protein
MSLPGALLHSLESVTGFDRAAFKAVHASGKQVTSVRLNPAKPFAAFQDTKPVLWCANGRYLSERPSFTLDPLLHAGAYYVQEASSMFLWYMLEQCCGDMRQARVLDLCAAPGGKSSLLASFFQDGWLVANEVIKSRAAILVENLTKWGALPVVITNNDPVHFQSLPGYFDVMVVDAPCSGSGLFRRDPDAIAEWSEDAVQLCSQRQQRILADALPALAVDGVLIYSTCSYSFAEDEAIADWLVKEQGMEPIAIPVPPEWGIVVTTAGEAGSTGYRFFPDKTEGEGLYMAAFRKKNQVMTAATHARKSTALQIPSKTMLESVHQLVELEADQLIFMNGDTLRAIPSQRKNDLQELMQALYIRKAGVALGEVKGKDLVPSHEMALCPDIIKKTELTALDKGNALQYLRRKDFTVPEGPTGWRLMGYEGQVLGWIKQLPNRINNYYPAEWRVVKE